MKTLARPSLFEVVAAASPVVALVAMFKSIGNRRRYLLIDASQERADLAKKFVSLSDAVRDLRSEAAMMTVGNDLEDDGVQDDFLPEVAALALLVSRLGSELAKVPEPTEPVGRLAAEAAVASLALIRTRIDVAFDSIQNARQGIKVLREKAQALQQSRRSTLAGLLSTTRH